MIKNEFEAFYLIFLTNGFKHLLNNRTKELQFLVQSLMFANKISS